MVSSRSFILLLLALAAPTTAAGEDFERLLAAVDPGLQTEWALRYEHAEGVARDYDRAVQLYCAAARRGDLEAQYRLGWMYANGRGVARDDALAAAWLRLAAAGGDAHAERLLVFVDDPERREPARCVRPDGSELLVSGAGMDADRAAVIAWVRALAPGYGLEPALVLALIEAESAFNPQARSPKDAQGLMQLIPETARRFGVADPMDPVQNLHGGMAYLRWLLEHFAGDLELALAGYNAGERAVERYGGIPPYPETQHYVRKVTRLYGRNTHPPLAAGDPDNRSRRES